MLNQIAMDIVTIFVAFPADKDAGGAVVPHFARYFSQDHPVAELQFFRFGFTHIFGWSIL